MKLTANKDKFINFLLAPASKLTDNISVEFDVENKSCKTFASSADRSLLLLSNIECEVTDPVPCIIPECKTFLRLISGLSSSSVTLSIDSNFIEYKDHSFSFKYHVLDEGYISNKKTISEDKLSKIQFDTEFVISKQKLSEIIKFNSIIPDAEKIYFFTQADSVYSKIGDDQKANTNEIVTEISTKFEGQSISNSFPINVQNILLFSFTSDEINVCINHQLKIIKFETPHLKYIVSGLVK